MGEVLSWVEEKGLDWVFDKFKDKWDKEKAIELLKSETNKLEIQKSFQRTFQQNNMDSLNRFLDYVASHYTQIQKSLADGIKQSKNEIQALKERAIQETQAKNDLQRENVTAFVDTIVQIIKNCTMKDVSTGEKMLAAQTGEAIIENITEVIKTTVSQPTPTPPASDLITVFSIVGKILYRDAEIETIKEKLGQGEKLLIWGFGGIGKTTVARKVFQDIRENYAVSGWIPYTGKLKKDILSAVNLFEETKKEEQEWWRQFNAYLHQTAGKKLFVIDNADDVTDEEEEEFRRVAGWMNTTLLVTSRREELSGFEAYWLDFLPEDSCLELFKSYYQNDINPKQIETIKKLIALAGRHTFTVELLAKSARRESNLESYYKKLKENGFSMSDLRVKTDYSGRRETLAEHLKKLFNLQKRTETEMRILRDFAVMPAGQTVTRDELKTWFDRDGNDLEPLVQNGWLQCENGEYAMHPLVQQIIHLYPIPEDTAEHFLDFVANHDNGYFDRKEPYTQIRRRVAIAESVSEWVLGKETLTYASICNEIAGAYQLSLGQYEEALEYHQKAIAIRERKLGTDHPATATSYNNIAAVYYDMGQYEDALEYNQKAIAIHERKPGTDHPDTATNYNNIAVVYYAMGQYEDALAYYQKAIAIRERKQGTDHPDTATSYNNIALVYYAMEQYEDALEYFQKAKVILESKLGTDHPDTATSYNNIALVYKAMGQYEDALEYYVKALKP